MSSWVFVWHCGMSRQQTTLSTTPYRCPPVAAHVYSCKNIYILYNTKISVLFLFVLLLIILLEVASLFYLSNLAKLNCTVYTAFLQNPCNRILRKFSMISAIFRAFVRPQTLIFNAVFLHIVYPVY